MPTFTQPKLGELYNTTFFYPSSQTSSIIIPGSNAPITDGTGGTFYAAIISMPALQSTVAGLGNSLYVSSTQVVSTVVGLSSAGYISSSQLQSTINGLTVAGFVTNPQLQSTTTGLGTAGYISTLSLTSTIGGLGSALYVSSTQLISTVNWLTANFICTTQNASTVSGLGSAGYISSQQLLSTTAGLGLTGYISSPQLLSTTAGLGTAGYVSSAQLLSTTGGLGTAGYISSPQLLSTVAGLGTANYISSTQLFSTTAGLGTSGYISSPQLLSTTAGLGSAGYVSSPQLLSTTAGLGSAGYVSSPQLLSTTAGLGTAGYLSTLSFFSTLNSLYSSFTTSTLRVIDTICTSKIQASNISTGLLNVGTLSANTVVVWGSNTLVVQGLSFLSSTTVAGNLFVSSVAGNGGIVQATQVSTKDTLVSTLTFGDIADGSQEKLFVDQGSLKYNNDTVIVNTTLGLALVSTTNGLGSANYISSPQLVSTTVGLGTANYISSSQLISTVAGLGTTFFISSPQLISTVAGLGSAGYVSSTQLQSTVNNLAQVGYVSSTQLASTVVGLAQAGYVSSTQLQSTVNNLAQVGYVSSTQLASTVAGLGTSGYISSPQLVSTVTSFLQGITTSTLTVNGASYAISSYNTFQSTTFFVGRDVNVNEVIPLRANNLAYSANATTWTNALNNGFQTEGNGIATNGTGLWVAVGDGSNALTSIKHSSNAGVTWWDAVSGGFSNSSNSFVGYGVAHAGGKWVAVGRSASVFTAIQSSTDGRNWSLSGFGNSANPVYGVTYAVGLGLWIAVGEGSGASAQQKTIHSSTDGVSWTRATSGGFSSGGRTEGYTVAAHPTLPIVWAGGYGNSGAQMWQSVDGATWTQRTGPNFLTGDTVNSIAYGNNIWVATGSNINPLGPTEQNIIYSTNNGTSWSFAAISFVGNEGRGVAYDGTKFVAVGRGTVNGGTVLASTDGLTWTSNAAVPFQYYGSYVGNAIAYSNSAYIAVGEGEQTTNHTKATLIGPSSISTAVLNVGTIYVDSIYVGGANTLEVDGSANFHGNATFDSSITASTVNVTGSLTLSGSNNTLNAPNVSTLNVQTSTLKFVDIASVVSVPTMFVSTSQLYFNNNQVLTTNALAGNVTLSNLTVLNTLSTSSTFTNTLSTNTLNARFMCTMNINLSSITFRDIQFPAITHRMFASSSQLFFNNINLTSSFAGNGCGVCIDSNIAFSNVLVSDTLSSFSTFTNFISTGFLTTGNQIVANSVSSIQFQGSSLNLYDYGTSSNFPLWAKDGNLMFGESTIGIIPDIVNSNLNLCNLRVLDSISSSSTFVNYISTNYAQASSFNLIDAVNGGAVPLYTRAGVLYFSTNQVLPYGPDMMFSTVAIRNVLSTSSTFANFLSAPIIRNRELSSLQLQASTILLTDQTAGLTALPLYTRGGALVFNGMAVATGGSTGANPLFSTVTVAQNISTASTFTRFLSAGQAFTSSLTAQVLQSRLVSTANTTLSSLTFVDGASRPAMYTSGTSLFHNNLPVAIGGTNSQNPRFSTLSIRQDLSASSTVTNWISTTVIEALQMQNTCTIRFIDAGTGSQNFVYTSSGTLYINNNPAQGAINVASNFTLCTLTVLATSSNASTFTSYLSSGTTDIDVLSTVNFSAEDAVLSSLTVTNDANVNGTLTTPAANVTALTVTTINGNPQPIFNYGSATTDCCPPTTGFAFVSFTTPYTTPPTVTVSLADIQNDYAILNIVNVTTTDFSVGSYDINTASLLASVTFNYIAIGT